MVQFAFLSGVGFQVLILLILFPALLIGILIALRAFFLWYWKVNVIIQNQELQNRLLGELIAETKRNNKTGSTNA